MVLFPSLQQRTPWKHITKITVHKLVPFPKGCCVLLPPHYDGCTVQLDGRQEQNRQTLPGVYISVPAKEAPVDFLTPCACYRPGKLGGHPKGELWILICVRNFIHTIVPFLSNISMLMRKDCIFQLDQLGAVSTARNTIVHPGLKAFHLERNQSPSNGIVAPKRPTH